MVMGFIEIHLMREFYEQLVENHPVYRIIVKSVIGKPFSIPAFSETCYERVQQKGSGTYTYES